MMFKSLTFGNINSKDLDMYISGTGAYDAPPRAFEMIDVPGRNGQLSIDGGRYENIEVTYPAGVFAESEEAFRAKMANIRAAFLSQVGYQRLTDEYNPDEYRLGIFSGGIEADPVARLKASEFDITFNCKPQRFLTSGEEPVTIGEYTDPVGTDNAPYLFRRSPQFADGYDTCIPTIVGGSVVGNQLVQIPTVATQTINGVTFTNNGDGSVTVNGTATADAVYDLGSFPFPKVGKYVITGCPSGGSLSTYYLGNASAGDIGLGWAWNITSVPSTTGFRIYVKNGTTISNKKFVPQCTNITAKCTAPIADRAYAMEQAQAGSGIAWLKSYGFISDSYEAYDTGTLKSVEATEHVTRGFNQWDEEWELGGIKYADGTPFSISDRFRSKNYCECIPNTDYYCARSIYIFYYDSDKNYISYDGFGVQGGILTTPNGCHYFKIVDTTTTTYNHDICINISDPSRNGEYEPYTSHTYPLGNVTLRGVPMLDGDRIYYNGDIYPPSGQVDRRYTLVDLGTLNWTRNNSYYDGQSINWFRSETLPNCADVPTGTMPKAICAKYVTSVSTLSEFFKGGTINIYQQRIGICDPNYASSDAATFKSAMSGVYLVYEKATPTTETADPYTTPMLCDPSGTEEWVTDNGVPVGHQTEYGPDPTILHNPTLFASKPLIKVTGAGTLGVGSYSMTITGTASQQLYIDCDLMEAWEDVGGARVPRNDRITYAGNKFPELDPGETGITTDGITAVEIVPRWWTL